MGLKGRTFTAERRSQNCAASVETGDSEALEFPDAHFDAITVAFGVRNFENLERGLREMLRVLKPGGRLIVLEFSQPRTPGVRQLYDLYLRLIAPNVGKMVSSSREARPSRGLPPEAIRLAAQITVWRSKRTAR